MPNPILVASKTIDGDREYMSYWWWCAGCAEATSTEERPEGAGAHRFDDRWFFNGSMESPTFRDSYLSYGIPITEDSVPGYPGAPRCHSFVTDGEVLYLGDTEHALVNQQVPMSPVPDWLIH